MAREIHQAGLDYIKQWEGLHTVAHCNEAGVWTVGYGHTAAAGRPFPHSGMKITEEEAEAVLLRDLEPYERAVETMVEVPLSDNQFVVLVSFCFNVGVASFKKSTLLKKLNAGDYDSVPSELMKWVCVTAGRKAALTKGLANRRAAEAGLWAKGEFVSSGYMQPVSRRENSLITPETIGPVIGAVAGLVGFTTGNGPFQWALAVVMIIACFVGAWYFIRRVKREAA